MVKKRIESDDPKLEGFEQEDSTKLSSVPPSPSRPVKKPRRQIDESPTKSNNSRRPYRRRLYVDGPVVVSDRGDQVIGVYQLLRAYVDHETNLLIPPNIDPPPTPAQLSRKWLREWLGPPPSTPGPNPVVRTPKISSPAHFTASLQATDRPSHDSLFGEWQAQARSERARWLRHLKARREAVLTKPFLIPGSINSQVGRAMGDHEKEK